MNPSPQRVADQARSLEREIAIDAPADAVWKALTDVEELTRWFPLEARVTPGTGGSIWMRWDDASDFDDTRIEIWAPERHLRTVGRGGTWVGIATDYYLQARGGGTLLRVVSSGFGAGEDWDDLLEAFGSGWDFELRGLRHYLERHRGRNRVAARARAPYPCSDREAWARLTEPGGWFGPDGLASLTEGARYATRTATGEELAGVVHTWQPPRQFSGTVKGWNEALLRVQLYGRVATLWLSTYGVPAADVRSLERSWQASLGGLFPAAR